MVFTGHMIDQPGRAVARFPASLEPAVTEAVGGCIDRIGPVAAYGSAACGADIICLEAALEHGSEIHVTLPFPPADFRPVSVDLEPGGSWGARFEKVLEAADSIVVASDHPAEGSVATFEYANLVLTGLGQLRAEVLGTSLCGLAVWDGVGAGPGGGTSSVVELWHERGLEVEHIDVRALTGAGPPPPAPSESPTPVRGSGRGGSEGQELRHEIKSMLFADAVGYSKLTENQIPIFIEHFLAGVADLNRRTDNRPIHMETAGDGLYFVFDHAGSAGRYALELSEFVRGRDWQERGLPETFNMRIALHCGPVFCGQDPITGLPLYTGSHTSRTARIEPITPPGQVYASSAFAAVAAAAGVDDLHFSYIGRTRLAKKYGSLTLFHVQGG
jgi:class 3 adenylate cyclase